MAILLGAFIIQGIVPGPDMLLPPPKGKLDLTFSFVWVIIISNFITVAVCFLFLNTLAKVTQVRGSLIIPLILLLIYLGAFAEKNAFQDMIVVLFFGGLGWIMEKLNWPRPPVLLGLVLGPLPQIDYFLPAIIRHGINWRPGVLIIFAVTLIGIFYPIIKKNWQDKASQPTTATVEAAPKGGLRFDRQVLFTVCVISLLALALWQSRNFGFRAGLFPWVIGTPTLLLALFQLAKEEAIRSRRHTRGRSDN
jgi:TctA family transporter